MTTDTGELLEVVDHDGKVIGLAERSELHRNPSLIHRVVHILIFNKKGELLLQKRSQKKDIAPGKWDTSVGGHVNPGEPDREAAEREMKEELGIGLYNMVFLYTYLFSNRRESELVSTFSFVYEGELRFNQEEIDEVRYWSLKEIRENIGKNIFSNHFEEEICRYLGTEID
jgi:isopentenyl-diphosphate delta-isomerase type 1